VKIEAQGWFAAALLLSVLIAPVSTPVASQSDSVKVQVARIIDGDTIRVCCVFGDRVKVRYEEEK
jgi:endonuclease YncB( thermonuclease family)